MSDAADRKRGEHERIWTCKEADMRFMTIRLSLSALALTLALGALARAEDIDWKKVDTALGKTGTALAGGVHRYGLPRTDLKVTLDGVTIRPTLALGGWVAFEPMGEQAMVMGDLVLT